MQISNSVSSLSIFKARLRENATSYSICLLEVFGFAATIAKSLIPSTSSFCLSWFLLLELAIINQALLQSLKSSGVTSSRSGYRLKYN